MLSGVTETTRSGEELKLAGLVMIMAKATLAQQLTEAERELNLCRRAFPADGNPSCQNGPLLQAGALNIIFGKVSLAEIGSSGTLF